MEGFESGIFAFKEISSLESELFSKDLYIFSFFENFVKTKEWINTIRKAFKR